MSDLEISMDEITSYIDSRGAELHPMSWSEALAIVHELARHNVLCAHQCENDEALERERKRQIEAVDTLEDLIVNHGETIDTWEPSEQAQEWDDEVWSAKAGAEISHPADAIKLCLELAEHNAIDPDECARDIALAEELDRQNQAFDLCRDFLGMHSERLKKLITSVPSPL